MVAKDSCGKSMLDLRCEWAEGGVCQNGERHERTARMMDLALEMAKAGAWNLNLETGELFWNNAYVRLLGLAPDFVPTLPAFLDLVHPDDRDLLTLDLQNATGNPAIPFQNRIRMLLPGGVRWMERKGQVLYDATGKPVQMIGITADVTEQKVVEDALLESEARYRTILQAAIDGFWMLDIAGRLLEVNAAYCRMSGYSQEELLALGVNDLVDPGATLHTDWRLARIVAQGEDRFELRLRRKDGSSFDAEVSAQYRPSEGGRVVAFLRDITERKLADKRIRWYLEQSESAREALKRNGAELALINAQLAVERNRAEAANQAKSDFLAIMSHELRTPMNSILGMADLLWDSQLNPEQRQYVEVFRRGGSNLLALINDVLDLSKIEAGRMELEQVPFDLKDVIDRAVELVRARARAKGIALMSRLAPGIPTAVVGDPTRLRQVFINLLGNAIKFTESGEVVLRVEKDDAGDPRRLAFSVSDTGIGIAPDKIETIFEDFKQADPSLARRYGGTGLGLSISRRLVGLMGGRLTVTSTLTQGSTFRFAVPLNDAPLNDAPPGAPVSREVDDFTGQRAAGPAPPPAPLPMRPGIRILVAEDSEDNRLLLQAYLKSGAHSLTFAGDGHDAVKQFAPGRFDLVLMDLQMPALGGLAATKIIRARERKSGLTATPILALTADARPEVIARSLAAGCDGHLSKPISKQRLLAAIEEYHKVSAPWQGHE